MAERVKVVAHADGVLEVRLARPDKMNAVDAAMFDAIVATGERLLGQAGLRAVVLSGEGDAFCAGLDKGAFGAMMAGAEGGPGGALGLAARTHGIANHAQRAVLVWRELPVPVVAAVHGVAFGAGFQLALGADLRFVAPDARLSIMEIRWGLVPDMGGTLLMRSLARSDVIRELTYSGRILSGEEAAHLGFATRVSPDPRAEALAWAATVAAMNPHAIRAAKRLLDRADAGSAPADQLLAESVEQDALIGSPNQHEAIRANLAGRPPRFDDA